MNEIIRCTRCLLPNTLKQMTFDEKGVCNHCLKYEKDFSNWDEIKDRKRREFEQILEKAKKLNRPYDCLVPLSGGKDSTYALYLATRVYNLRTLSVTLDNGYLSNVAKDNIRNALAHCDTDHMYYHINKKNNEILFKKFVERTGDFCNACMREINYAIEFSSKGFHIPLIIKGSGRRVQYVSQIQELSSLNTPSYFHSVIKGSKVYHRFRHIARNRYKLEIQKVVGGVLDVAGIPRTFMMRFFPQHIGLYDYIYNPFNEITEILKLEMGWKDGGGEVEHLDCQLHDIPFYRHTLKIPNIGKNTFRSSGLIRQGIISREDGLVQEKYDLENNEIPPELKSFLSKIGLTYEEYVHAVVSSDKSAHISKIQKIAREFYHKFRKY